MGGGDVARGGVEPACSLAWACTKDDDVLSFHVSVSVSEHDDDVHAYDYGHADAESGYSVTPR
jgi:hypothetical protein